MLLNKNGAFTSAVGRKIIDGRGMTKENYCLDASEKNIVGSPRDLLSQKILKNLTSQIN